MERSVSSWVCETADGRIPDGFGTNGSGTEEPVKRADVDFLSEGVLLRAWLYIPEGAGPFPAIALGHGFTGIKDGFLHHDYPGVFAAAGFIALAFDYPNSGESEGDMR